MEFVELNEEEFTKEVVKLHNANFYQTVAWAELKKSNGWQPLYVGLKKANKIIGASLILIKKFVLGTYMGYAPRGFLIDFNNYEELDFFTKEIKKYAKEKKIVFVKIDPYYDYQQRDCDGNIVENGYENKDLVNHLKSLGYHHHGFHQNTDHELQPRWIEVLDIKDKSYDDIYKEMRKTVKKRINRSYNEYLSLVSITDKSQLKDFKELMQDTANRRGFIDRPLTYYEKMFDVLTKKDMLRISLVEFNFKKLKEISEKELKETNEKLVHLENGTGPYKQFLTEEKKLEEKNSLTNDQESLTKRIKEMDEEIAKYGETRMVSTIMFIPYLKEMLCLFGASYKEYMKYNIQYLINADMIKYACDNHYEIYNCYGIDGFFNEDSEGFGLFDFKRGLGCIVHELIGEFDLVVNKPLYYAYNIAFKSYKRVKNVINKIKR